MLREGFHHSLTWADKTMSVIHARQLEACEERITSLPTFGLFSGCTDANAEELWRISYDAMEHPFSSCLHKRNDLIGMVMGQLPIEAALLSPKEHELLERIIALDGNAELLDWTEPAAAESLVRRLWCTLTVEEGDRLFIHLPKEIMTPLLLVMSSKAHQELISHVFDLHRTVYAVLYRQGVLHYSVALNHLKTDVLSGTYAEHEQLAMRFLRTAFDYLYDRRGEMLLLHPGLTDPQLLPYLDAGTDVPFDFDDPSLELDALFDETEWLAAQQMMGVLGDCLRPEIQPNTAAEDLFMLAKQGVPLAEMRDVLAAMLTCMPTAPMLDCLRLLKSQVVCWGRIPTGMVQ